MFHYLLQLFALGCLLGVKTENCWKFSILSNFTTFWKGDPYAICDELKDEGFACGTNPPQNLFYYDGLSGFCEPLNYKGCGGNGNQFASLEWVLFLKFASSASRFWLFSALIINYFFFYSNCETFCIVQGEARPQI